MSKKNQTNINRIDIATIDSSLKHISEHDLAKIIKQVHRRRQKQQDEYEWKQFYSKIKQEQDVEASTSFKNIETSFNNLETRKTCDVSEICASIQDDFHEEVTEIYRNEYSGEYSISDEHVFNNKDLNLLEKDLDKQPQPLSLGVLKKMKDLASSLNKIGEILNSKQNDEVDSDSIERNLKRNKEFITLFARNYVYPLKRQKKEAKKILVVGVPLPQQKLALMFQTLLLSIQMYERQLLKFTCHKKSLQQLLLIVDYIKDLMSLVEKVMGTNIFPHRNELVNGCIDLQRVIAECAKYESDTVSSVAVKKKAKKGLNNKKVQDTLSMYVSKQPKICWKQTSAKLARSKFGPPSFQKTQKQRNEKQILKITSNDKETKSKKSSPNQKSRTTFEEQDNIQESKHKHFGNTKTINKNFRSSTRAVPEESVVTMMQMLKPQAAPNTLQCTDTNVDAVTVQRVKSTISLPKNIQIVCIKCDEEKKEDTNISDLNTKVEVDSASPTQALLVSKYDRDIALTYKQKLIKNLKLYEDRSNPWDIVTRISDDVTFDIVQNVCKSIESFVDIIVKKLFELEFK